MAGAGKNEAAKALVKAGWIEAAFATKMRQAVLAIDPWIDVRFDGAQFCRLSEVIAKCGWDDAKRTYPEVRRLLQRFGTEAGRDIHGEQVWVNLVLDPWWDTDGTTNLVVTDCRFPNEAESIRSMGGMVVRITRPGLAPIPGGHASEAGVPDEMVDHTIANDGTISALHAAMLATVHSTR